METSITIKQCGFDKRKHVAFHISDHKNTGQTNVLTSKLFREQNLIRSSQTIQRLCFLVNKVAFLHKLFCWCCRLEARLLYQVAKLQNAKYKCKIKCEMQMQNATGLSALTIRGK